jgi:hypothetical protein
MTNEELDRLWFKAMRQSVEEDKAFIRYHFAALVAAAEREACAKVCDEKYESVPKNDPYAEADGDYSDLIYAGAAQDCAEAIRARGDT